MVNTRQWRNQREQSRKLPPPPRWGSSTNSYLRSAIYAVTDRLCSAAQIVWLTRQHDNGWNLLVTMWQFLKLGKLLRHSWWNLLSSNVG